MWLWTRVVWVDVSGTRGWNSNMVSHAHTNTHTIILRMVMDVVEVCRLLCSCDVHLMSEWFTTSSPFQLNGACRNKSKCVQVSKVSKYVSVHLTFISGRGERISWQLLKEESLVHKMVDTSPSNGTTGFVFWIANMLLLTCYIVTLNNRTMETDVCNMYHPCISRKAQVWLQSSSIA